MSVKQSENTESNLKSEGL